jgi:N-acetylmuramoyl-L-alanine amidase
MAGNFPAIYRCGMSDLPDARTPAAMQPDSPLAQRIHPSPNFGARRGVEAPDSVILHYTGMPTAAEALLWLANPLSQVSAHYFVFEDGRIFQMVPESARAWHAGKSSWHGETDMNSRSIGIEIANIGPDLGKGFASEVGAGSREANPSNERILPIEPGNYPDFPDAQIAAVIALVKDIATRWRIPAHRILAHSDIAPGRKVDPGERFPWDKLAAAGLGLWAAPPQGASDVPRYAKGDEGMPVRALQAMLARFGYGLDLTGVFDQRTEDVVSAFQRHWRQSRVDGVADGETLARLMALLSPAPSV